MDEHRPVRDFFNEHLFLLTNTAKNRHYSRMYRFWHRFYHNTKYVIFLIGGILASPRGYAESYRRTGKLFTPSLFSGVIGCMCLTLLALDAFFQYKRERKRRLLVLFAVLVLIVFLMLLRYLWLGYNWK